VLLYPALLVVRPGRPELVRLERRRAPRMLAPARAVEVVEHRRAPVLRLAGAAYREDGCRLLREAHTAVARIPDVPHADRLLRAVVEVPMFPAEECVLGNRSRAGEREGSYDDSYAGAECQPARTFRQPCEQDQ